MESIYRKLEMSHEIYYRRLPVEMFHVTWNLITDLARNLPDGFLQELSHKIDYRGFPTETYSLNLIMESFWHKISHRITESVWQEMPYGIYLQKKSLKTWLENLLKISLENVWQKLIRERLLQETVKCDYRELSQGNISWKLITECFLQ